MAIAQLFDYELLIRKAGKAVSRCSMIFSFPSSSIPLICRAGAWLKPLYRFGASGRDPIIVGLETRKAASQGFINVESFLCRPLANPKAWIVKVIIHSPDGAEKRIYGIV